MRHVCIKCGLSSRDGNLWCQRRDCASVYLNALLRPGERVADLEIRGVLRVMRTAAVYQAVRAGKPVLVKMAHIGDEFAEDLKQEAKFLYRIWKDYPGRGYPAFFPRLLPAIDGASLDEKLPPLYARLAIDDHLRYYMVFENIEGTFLRDLLDDNPRPPYNHVGWLAIGLLKAVRFMHDELKLHHGAICPEMISVRLDADRVMFPVLFDLGLRQPVGGVIPVFEALPREDYETWLTTRVPAAYAAPELYDGRGGQSADIYGVGLIFYELLTGHAAFDKHSTNYEAVLESVRSRRWKALPYREKELRSIVEKSLRTPSMSKPTQPRESQAPFASLEEMGGALTAVFGDVPKEKKKEGWFNPRNQTRLMWAALVVLLTLVLIALPTAITSFAVNALP